jgi:hypothetical protein
MSKLITIPEPLRSSRQGAQMEALLSRLSNMPWFASASLEENRMQAETALSAFGCALQMEKIQVRWLTKREVADAVKSNELATDPLWRKLADIPARIRRAAEERERETWLAFALDDVPEHVFHRAYDGAFRAFQSCGETVVFHAVGTALYVSGLSAAYEMLSDVLGTNPFLPLIDAMETGHFPVAVLDGRICAC